MISKRQPMHPGEVLREEFLLPLGLSPGALAKACGLPRSRIARIAGEQTDVTADTALRLSKTFGTSAEFWLNLQNSFDLRTAQGLIGDQLAKIRRVIGNAAE
jgi:addiction module HigA family antidote